MNPMSMPHTPSIRAAALLLPALPATVATAAFAHGHGALGSHALGLILLATIAVGTGVGHRLLTSLAPRVHLTVRTPR